MLRATMLLVSLMVISGCNGVPVNIANDTADAMRYTERWPARFVREYVDDDVLRLILSSYDDTTAAVKIIDLVDDVLDARALNRFTDENKTYIAGKLELALGELRRLLEMTPDD